MDVGGAVAPGFEPVRDAFVANFAERGEIGAACCLYAGATPVVDVWAGTTAPGGDEPYGPRTVQIVASATKGALAICTHRLAERGELDLDAPVARYWPEFAAAGKDEIPVRWLLSHRSGVVAADAPLTVEDALDWDTCVAALAAATPSWQPGRGHGYHAFSYGWLVGEVLARVSGTSPGRLFAAEVAAPLGLDLHIGLPRAEHGRVSSLVPAAPPPPGTPPDALLARMREPGSLAHRAFHVDTGLFTALLSDRRTWEVEIPAANGMGTAHALARMYAACWTDVDGVQLLGDDTLAGATAEQAHGDDLVAGYETRYASGFQLPFPFRPMAGPGSFGHYGLGGSLGFAHPRLGFSFGYTTNQMYPGTPADPRTRALVDAVVSCVG